VESYSLAILATRAIRSNTRTVGILSRDVAMTKESPKPNEIRYTTTNRFPRNT
jgi:hypothetical protein